MDNVMSFSIDVGVMINDLITSGEKGAEYSSKSSTIVMYTFSTCHERKPRLHNGTVMEDTDKLVRIPPSGHILHDPPRHWTLEPGQ